MFWNYERGANYVVLSEHPLRKPEYVDVWRTSVYDVEPGDGTGGRVRLPADIDGVVRSNFLEGQRVYYLAYDEMEDGDNGTLYLLTAAQFRRLLPGGVQAPAADGEESLREAVLDLPAFLPVP